MGVCGCDQHIRVVDLGCLHRSVGGADLLDGGPWTEVRKTEGEEGEGAVSCCWGPYHHPSVRPFSRPPVRFRDQHPSRVPPIGENQVGGQ